MPTHVVTVMVPLVDLDAQSGATVPDPGTHRGEASGEPIPAYVPKGGCYLMHYDLQHWGGANSSEQDRPLLAMTYARPWFTDSQNFGTIRGSTSVPMMRVRYRKSIGSYSAGCTPRHSRQ